MKSNKISPIVYVYLIIGVAILWFGVGRNIDRRGKGTYVYTEQTHMKSLEELQQEQAQERERAIDQQKSQLRAAIEILDKPFDISGYINSPDGINALVQQISARASLIQAGESSEIVEIQDLARQIKPKAVSYQIKAFPILRKAFATCLNRDLWINDGKAYSSGNSNIYITIVSPELVLNRQKQEAHLAIRKTLNDLRFRQARYKYYDGSEYTYWNVFEGKDADL